MHRTEHFVVSAAQTATRCHVTGFMQWGVTFTEIDLEDKRGDRVQFLVVMQDQGNAKLNEAAALSRAADLMFAVQEDGPLQARG